MKSDCSARSPPLALAAAHRARPRIAAKDVVFAVASTFTTTDPYDANDTLSQAMAKSFYEGLFGFDKDMKMIPVLAESYDVSKDGLVYTVKLKQRRQVPRRHRLQGRRRQGEPRPRDQSREQAEALRPVQQQHREDRGGRRLHGAHHAEDAVLAVHRAARASVHGDDQPGRAASSTAARTSRSIRSAPARSSSSSGRPPTTSRSPSSTATGARAIRRSTRSRGSRWSTTTRAPR